MKVKLRIQKGIITGPINIPDNCLYTEYRLPLHREMGAKLIGDVQDMITSATTRNKCLIFRWNQRDFWGSTKEPIMDLVDYY